MDDLARFCCLNPECRLYGQRDAGNLYVRAHYGSQRWRLLCCRACGRRFSERKGTPLFGSKLPEETSRSLGPGAPERGVRRAPDGAADQGEPRHGRAAGPTRGRARQRVARRAGGFFPRGRARCSSTRSGRSSRGSRNTATRPTRAAATAGITSRSTRNIASSWRWCPASGRPPTAAGWLRNLPAGRSGGSCD